MIVRCISREEISFAFTEIASLDIYIFTYFLEIPSLPSSLFPVLQYVIVCDVPKTDAKCFFLCRS